ncbi:MAG: EAL domain-containing protein [Pseudomonadota bacterium]
MTNKPLMIAGMDVLYTKIAVDFQNVTDDSWDETVTACLTRLCETSRVDSVFLALYSDQADSLSELYVATREGAAIQPQTLKGQTLSDESMLINGLGHLRLSEIVSSTHPPEHREADCRWLAEAGIESIIMIGLSVQQQPRGFLAFATENTSHGWDASFHLLLKLMGSSIASGMERMYAEGLLRNEQERTELALFSANDGIWDFDVATNKVYFSPRWKRMLGYDEDEFEESMPDWTSLVHPDDLARVQSSLRDHLDGRTELFESIHRMRHRSGEWRWLLSRAKAKPDHNGRLKRLVGVELDVTERKLYEEALFREKESAQITLQSIGDGVITTDADCIVEYLNPVAEELTGWKLEDASGRPVDDIFRGFHEETCEPLENPLAVSIRRKRSIKSIRPTLLIRRDGNELYIESNAAPIRDGRGNFSGGVLVFHDVSESRELNRRLSYHASHDILTGLVNRREFESRLERALRSAKAGETEYALCYFDLDQFKMVNDSCGHTAGDTLLGQLGSLLKSKIRWRDTLARLGGDEFGLLLESCSLDEALQTAEELREAIEEFKFMWDERTFRLGVSIGVVPITNDNEDITSILTAADSACASAKEAGRNRIHCFQENDIELMRRRREMQWAARINNALEEDRFELYRQLIRPLSSSEEGLHYEILLRMRDENGAVVTPDVFISAAERYSITPNIDRWVIENTLRWLISEADERERLTLCSINLSGQSLGDDKFLPFVIDQFRTSGIDATKICFEITETAAIASYSQASRFINSLKELGCQFALDDFGTGMSSFGYLKHFPVDYLKIDGSFVKEILRDPIDREMVRSINEIGHLTGKKTIAEFAENDEIINVLQEMKVDYAQGYGVSVPKRVKEPISELDPEDIFVEPT